MPTLHIHLTELISKLRNTSVPRWMSKLWRVLRQYNWAAPLPLKYIMDITFAQLELSNAWTQETWNLISWCGILKTETTLKVKQKLSWKHTKNMNITTRSSNTSNCIFCSISIRSFMFIYVQWQYAFKYLRVAMAVRWKDLCCRRQLREWLT